MRIVMSGRTTTAPATDSDERRSSFSRRDSGLARDLFARGHRVEFSEDRVRYQQDELVRAPRVVDA
jgi:hypothetical protein